MRLPFAADEHRKAVVGSSRTGFRLRKNTRHPLGWLTELSLTVYLHYSLVDRDRLESDLNLRSRLIYR